MKCIYCLGDKQVTSFTKAEHVLPQAFGKFRHNLTLHGVVCDTCNKFFGDNLELYLGRDSFEGMARFDYGVKKQHDFKSPGKQSRLSVKVNEGPFKGAYAYREFSEQDQRITVKPIPQVGFKKPDGMGYEYFSLDRIPDKEYLDNNFELKKRKSIVTLGCSSEVARKYFLKKGISFQPDTDKDYVPEAQESWECEVTGQIDQTIFRAIAKIAFNYLSYWMGSEFVSQSAFHPIRQYILHGEKTAYPSVVILENAILSDEPVEGKRRLGHLIILDKSKNSLSIVSKVSLFNLTTYSVLLAKDYQGIDFVIRKGQLFNVANGDILELAPMERPVY